MSHYDECREKYASMTDADVYNEYLIDEVKEKVLDKEEKLKRLLLQKYLLKHSKFNDEYTDPVEYWEGRKEDIDSLIKKVTKKINNGSK